LLEKVNVFWFQVRILLGLLTIKPVVEKILSDGTEIAGVHTEFMSIIGNCSWFHNNAYSSWCSCGSLSSSFSKKPKFLYLGSTAAAKIARSKEKRSSSCDTTVSYRW